MKLDDFAMVGAGSLGSVLCRSLTNLGLRLDLVVVRNEAAGRRIVEESDSGASVTLDQFNGTSSSLMILAVPDDHLEDVAQFLAPKGIWAGKTVLHTSGVHNRSVLAPFEAGGASTGSFHPLQTFVGHEDASSFKGITVGIEGDTQALTVAKQLANGLLADSVQIPSGSKQLYHAAASIAGNAAITLMSISEELWEKAVGTREGFPSAMGPLVRQSVENAISMHPEKALTGPVVRGDVGTLGAHLEAIEAHAPHLLSLYCSVATETVHLAMRSGRLPADQAVALLDVINDHIKGIVSSD